MQKKMSSRRLTFLCSLLFTSHVALAPMQGGLWGLGPASTYHHRVSVKSGRGWVTSFNKASLISFGTLCRQDFPLVNNQSYGSHDRRWHARVKCTRLATGVPSSHVF